MDCLQKRVLSLFGYINIEGKVNNIDKVCYGARMLSIFYKLVSDN